METSIGILLALVAIAVEIGLAAFCVTTRSNQKQARSIIRIASLPALALLAVLVGADWGPRYYGLAALMLVMAVGAAVALARGREGKPYQARRIILRTLGATLLIIVASLPAIVFPQYRALATTGEYVVATLIEAYTDPSGSETYVDTGEKRTLNLQLWYPESAEGPLPLVVFSHGGLGIKTSNESLCRELASHGYVVCAIDHTYQCLYTTAPDGRLIRADRGYVHELSVEDAQADRQQSYEYYQKWMAIRTGDINAVIEHLVSQAQSGDARVPYSCIDPARIGVIGHSLGGSAALGVGRVRTDVKAVIALESPFLCDIKGVAGGEFVFADKVYPVPVLNVYSDSSWGHLGEWPQYRENHDLLAGTAATAFSVHISGVGHFSLTDLALTSPALTRLLNRQPSTANARECLTRVNGLCLEFLDGYLKGEGGSGLPDGQ